MTFRVFPAVPSGNDGRPTVALPWTWRQIDTLSAVENQLFLAKRGCGGHDRTVQNGAVRLIWWTFVPQCLSPSTMRDAHVSRKLSAVVCGCLGTVTAGPTDSALPVPRPVIAAIHVPAASDDAESGPVSGWTRRPVASRVVSIPRRSRMFATMTLIPAWQVQLAGVRPVLDLSRGAKFDASTNYENVIHSTPAGRSRLSFAAIIYDTGRVIGVSSWRRRLLPCSRMT